LRRAEGKTERERQVKQRRRGMCTKTIYVAREFEGMHDE